MERSLIETFESTTLLGGGRETTMSRQFDDLGKDPQGNKVTAATDDAGPQVIVQGKEIHLLSRPLKDHEEAVALGKRVVAGGTAVYPDWMDLKNGGIGENLFAVFGGCFRGGYVDEKRLAEDARKIEAGHALRREIEQRRKDEKGA